MHSRPRRTPLPGGNGGFTLLELIIVISILSIIGLVVFPRISSFLQGERGRFVLLTGIIAKTFDDAFLRGNMNYCVIHLNQGNAEMTEYDDRIFSRKNGISVVTLAPDGKFFESPNRLLKYQSFPDSFRFEEVLLENGESAAQGNVLIPFYPAGYADNAILHILVNGSDRWSVRIYRFKKEAKIISGYVTFEQGI